MGKADKMKKQYKKFVFGETLQKAILQIPESEQLRFYRIIVEYGIDGIEPVLDGFESAVWVQMKDMIDNTMPARRGAPEGNKNAKNKKNNSDQIDLIVFDETINDELNELKQINQLEKDENKCANDNVNDNVNVNENGNGKGKENGHIDFKNQKPPPQILKKITSEAHRLGFTIGEKKNIEFYYSGIDPTWYEGPYSFLSLAAEKVTTAKYQNKSHEDQENLFIDAVLHWDNLRLIYPSWLEDRKREAAEEILREEQKKERAEKEAKIQKARDAAPKLCECGKPLDETLSCIDCKVTYSFDENLLQYAPAPMSELICVMQKKRGAHGPGP
jgi:hypothetical protein